MKELKSRSRIGLAAGGGPGGAAICLMSQAAQR